jgi:putative transposase
MRSLAVLLIHFLTSLVRLSKSSGHKALIAENLLLKQQLMVIARTRQRAPHLKTIDRLILGLLALVLFPTRIAKTAIIIQPSTLLRFHKDLIKRKYLQLFSCTGRSKPGPKGPQPELVKIMLAIKQRNPHFGCPRIAQIFSYTFGIEINKDVVRRVLEKHYRPDPGSTRGPSWLSFLGNIKDNLWSIDLFRCESIAVRSHWVLLVMEQWSRQIVGFSVHAGPVDGPTVRCMFNRAVSAKEMPKCLSSDHDPLFRNHRW